MVVDVGRLDNLCAASKHLLLVVGEPGDDHGLKDIPVVRISIEGTAVFGDSILAHRAIFRNLHHCPWGVVQFWRRAVGVPFQHKQ